MSQDNKPQPRRPNCTFERLAEITEKVVFRCTCCGRHYKPFNQTNPDPATYVRTCLLDCSKPKPQAVTTSIVPPHPTMLDDSEWLAILPCIHRTEQREPGSAACCGGAINLYPVYGCNQRAKCATLTYHAGQKEVACYTCPDRATINPTTGQPEKQPRPVPPLPPNPAAITAAGICHICQKPGAITFCRYCGHWLCSACSTNWLARGWAALKEQLGFTRPNCCGPTDTPVQ